MQTFVPSPIMTQCPKLLDRQRLGKQRVEVLQILRALSGQTKGWNNHPATRMWKGHQGALAIYGILMCQEWTRRGYKDTCEEKISQYLLGDITVPKWWGGEIHSSHRAALLAKAPSWYAKFGWAEEPKINYLWPSP